MLLGCCHCPGDSTPPSDGPPASQSSQLETVVCSVCAVAPARFAVTVTMPTYSPRCIAGCDEYSRRTILYYTGACVWESSEKGMSFSRTAFNTIPCCDMTDSRAVTRFTLQLTGSNTYALTMRWYGHSSGTSVLKQWLFSRSFGSAGSCITPRTISYSSRTSATTAHFAPSCASGGGVPASPCGNLFFASPTAATVSAYITYD